MRLPFGFRLTGSLLAAAVIVLGCALLYGSCTTYVAPNEVGILESRLVPPTGIRKELHPGGRLYFLLVGQTMHRFPTDLQVLTLTADPEDVLARNARIERPIEVNTADGSKVGLEVAVLYRIEDPFAIIQQAGPGRLFETTAVVPKTMAALKKNLGEMVAEDFYNVKIRIQRAEAALAQVQAELKDKGIAVDHLLLQQYSYNPAYQQQIEEKKVQDQLKFTRASEAEAAKQLAKKQEIEAKGSANVAIEVQRGQAEVTKIEAEADAYRRKRVAEADLLLELANAQGTELENRAYQGLGSGNLVGLKMAEVLRGLDTVVIPAGGKNGVNPLDLEQALELFDMPREDGAAPEAAP
jgi:regulator of protease activity HflC (stomatin/prohibitin superfamily)